MSTVGTSQGRLPLASSTAATAATTLPDPVNAADNRLRRRRGLNAITRSTLLARAASPLALLVLWQVGSSRGVITERVLPAPSAIVRAGLETYRDGSLGDALRISTERVALGFALGAAAGVALGILVGLSRLADHVIDPPLQMIRTIPFLGLIPLFILWFGIGETPKIAMVALGVSFPLYLNVSAAIRHVDPKLVETAQVLRFTLWQRIRVVLIPSAVPQTLVGLRQSLGIAWLSLIVAEQINADAGIGYIINNANAALRTDIVVFGLLLYALLGLATDGVVRLCERRALRWRPVVAR
jgi:sulfonate transport system permease protein